jgi:hypothetical protein
VKVFQILALIFCTWNVMTGLLYLARRWKLTPILPLPARPKGTFRALALIFGTIVLLLAAFSFWGIAGRAIQSASAAAYLIFALQRADKTPSQPCAENRHVKRHFYWG